MVSMVASKWVAGRAQVACKHKRYDFYAARKIY